MSNLDRPEAFYGLWTDLVSPGQTLEIARDGAQYTLQQGSRREESLDYDPWKNLCSENCCVVLHPGYGHLFGARIENGDLSLIGGSRGTGTFEPVCGEDDPLFEPLIGRNFRIVKLIQANYRNCPVIQGDWIRLVRITEGEKNFFDLFRLDSDIAFDRLCPDRNNGCLMSHTPLDNGAIRCISRWEVPQGKSRVLSMVTLPKESLAELAEAKDLEAAARKLRLLPCEAELLLETAGQTKGDPLIIWGADDGGG